MKREDLGLIAIVVIFSAVISIVVSSKVIVSPKNRQQQVEVVQPITANFDQPDKHYFNENSFDPTKPITIGEQANPDPFRGSQ